jgi:hypothetical protein
MSSLSRASPAADEPNEKTPLMEEEKKGFLSRTIGAVGSGVSGVVHGAGSVVGKVANTAERAGVNLGGKLGDKYNAGLGFYDKLFLKHINRNFGDHLEVASRGACFVVVCALPFVLPHEICPACEEVVRLEIYTAVSITYFVYTLYVYTGDILHFAQGGVSALSSQFSAFG